MQAAAAQPRHAVYPGWIALTIAALAMVATFPGRTFGIGIITEALIADIGVSRVDYARYNLIATLIGAAFCLPVGRLNDRVGARITLTVTALALGASVLYLTLFVRSAWELLIALVLLRGFGQSALSVISLAVIGKWFRRRLPLASGIYSILISVGFATAFGAVGAAGVAYGWRDSWTGMALLLLLGLAPIAAWILRSTPESAGVAIEDEPAPSTRDAGPGVAATLSEALRTPRFWLFGLCSAVFACVSSALLLFQQAILADLGFDQGIYLKTQIVSLLFGLAFNFLAGWAGEQRRLETILALGMTALAATLGTLPLASAEWHAYVYGACMGASGGVVTVIFFTAWPKVFGRDHVGHIQGAAQLLTVLASAAGPLALAEIHERTGRYDGMLYAAVPVCVALSLWAWSMRGAMQGTDAAQAVTLPASR